MIMYIVSFIIAVAVLSILCVAVAKIIEYDFALLWIAAVVTLLAIVGTLWVATIGIFRVLTGF